MSRSPHRTIRCLVTLAATHLALGCAGDIEPEASAADAIITPQDVPPPEPDVPAAEPDTSEVAPETTLADIAPASDVSSGPADADDTSDPSVPDVPLPTGPPEDLPSDKATWSCVVDVECAGCAGTGTCVDGVCRYPGAHCVIADAEGGWASCVPDATSAPDSSCLQCTASVAPERWSGLWAEANFEEGFAPFGSAVHGAPEAAWSLVSTRAHGGEFSAHLGGHELGTYESSGRSWARLHTPFMSTANGFSGTLRFWLWLETEQTPGFDVLRVLAVRSKDSDVLWTSDSIGGTTDDAWILVEVDVQGTPGIPTQLAIEFDTVDDILNDLEGPYIDGVTFSTGCCSADADCVTSDACLAGTCGADGLCGWEPLAGCCNAPSDCQTTGPCFEPLCTGPGGTCSEVPIEDCCETAFDCSDGDPCSQEVCRWPGALCEHINLCCMQDDDCYAPDPCLTGTCVQDECAYTNICCSSDADCVDTNACTVGTCVDSLCLTTLVPVVGCCVEGIYSESFDSGLPLAGWSLAGMTNGVGWSVVTPGLSGQPSPPGALYYGNPATWSYSSGGVNHGKVRLPFVTLPVGVEVTVSFAVLIEVQASGSLDTFDVQVNGPSGWQTLVTKSSLILGQWQVVTIDLSALAGQSVQLAFDFDTVTAFDNDGLGIMIDDLVVSTSCEPRPCVGAADCASTDSCLHGVCQAGVCSYVDSCCQSDGECDDDNPCTIDACTNMQECEFVPVIQCCVGPAECDDGDLCTLDVCTSYGGMCINPQIDGCCHDSGECDDADPCTVDQCLDNVCAHGWECCESDADCDDGDDVCTIDDCVGGFCNHAPSGLQGCCLTDPIQWDFETPVAFELTATAPPCGWSMSNVGDAWSGSGVLYYGNPAMMNFACEWNAGTATSPEITLMAGFAYTLAFAANLDVESNDTYDTLDVYAVLQGGQKVLLWEKSQMLGTDTWFVYTVDLASLAGASFRLLFDFDTHDNISNDSSGLYIDDIHITSTCLPKPCSDDFQCADGLAGTTESCGLSGCEYTIP